MRCECQFKPTQTRQPFVRPFHGIRSNSIRRRSQCSNPTDPETKNVISHSLVLEGHQPNDPLTNGYDTQSTRHQPTHIYTDTIFWKSLKTIACGLAEIPFPQFKSNPVVFVFFPPLRIKFETPASPPHHAAPIPLAASWASARGPCPIPRASANFRECEWCEWCKWSRKVK